MAENHEEPSTRRSRGARERLLEAANDLFYAQGVRTVGINKVIEVAGVVRGSLYKTFGSKDALIEAYLEGQHESTLVQRFGSGLSMPRVSDTRSACRSSKAGVWSLPSSDARKPCEAAGRRAAASSHAYAPAFCRVAVQAPPRRPGRWRGSRRLAHRSRLSEEFCVECLQLGCGRDAELFA